MNSDDRQLSAEMTATLFTQLKKGAAVGLVADIAQGSWTSATKTSRIGRPSPR